MAIYHLSVSTISRSAGRSATAAAAYRAGEKIIDERSGEIFDYRRKGGVEHSEIILPAEAPDWAQDRAALWNAAELAEKRVNSTVAREFEIALPAELSPDERKRLALDFARELVEHHGCAADVCIHAPGKGGDQDNHHAHILLTTRRLGPKGFTEKTRELDAKATGPAIVKESRERYANMQNERLRESGSEERVDHRTLEAQGITDREPGIHLGPAATEYERRTGEPSDKRLNHEAAVAERLQAAKEAGELERELSELDQEIIDLSGDLRAAIRERNRLRERAAKERRERRERKRGMTGAAAEVATTVTPIRAGVDQRRANTLVLPEGDKKPPESDAAKIVREYDEEYGGRWGKLTVKRREQALEIKPEMDRAVKRHRQVRSEEPVKETGFFAWFKQDDFENRYAAWQHVDQACEKKAVALEAEYEMRWKEGTNQGGIASRKIERRMERENPGRTAEVEKARKIVALEKQAAAKKDRERIMKKFQEQGKGRGIDFDPFD